MGRPRGTSGGKEGGGGGDSGDMVNLPDAEAGLGLFNSSGRESGGGEEGEVRGVGGGGRAHPHVFAGEGLELLSLKKDALFQYHETTGRCRDLVCALSSLRTVLQA
jgi:hypothetical protein